MKSDENTMLKPEWIKEDNGRDVRLFAYSCALSGNDEGALNSAKGKAKDGAGISGLRKELEKTKLDV